MRIFLKKTAVYICFCLLILLFQTCKSDQTKALQVSVPSSFQPYVDKFIAEAKIRGVAIDLAKNGLIVKYESLKSRDAAGLCAYKYPNEVTVDPSSWYNAPESFSDFLIFHELGHCVLNRGHRNDVLPNGEWTSIMRGDPETPGRTWTVNFNGARRKYYLDELFNKSISTPAFANQTYQYSDFAANKKKIIYADDFSKDTNRWFTDNTTDATGKVENGLYTYQRKSSYGFVGIDVKIDTTKNFEIETSLKILTSSSFTGLVFGGEREDGFTYLLYQNNGSVLLGQNLRQNNSLYYPLNPPQLKIGSFNKLTVRKVGNFYYFFINEQFFYANESLGFTGNTIGFFTQGTATLQIDNLQVSYLE